jgi:hypothetical protein
LKTQTPIFIQFHPSPDERYLELASGLVRAAICLPYEQPGAIARALLLGQAIELALKSYLFFDLVRSGVSERTAQQILKSRRFGHDILKLCQKAACQAGPAEIDDEEVWLARIAQLHGAPGYASRYGAPFVLIPTDSDCERTRKFVTMIAGVRRAASPRLAAADTVSTGS